MWGGRGVFGEGGDGELGRGWKVGIGENVMRGERGGVVRWVVKRERRESGR